MRIAQIMLAKQFGGAERSFVDLSRALAARGHAILAIGEQRGVALRQLAAHRDIECAPVRCRGAWDPFCRRQIKRCLVRFAPDLVQTHLARAAHLGEAPGEAADSRPWPRPTSWWISSTTGTSICSLQRPLNSKPICARTASPRHRKP